MTARHDRCLIDTFMLEVEIFGEAVSASVLAGVREIDRLRLINAGARYGGSRALGEQFIPKFKTPPPPPKPSAGGPTKASGS